MRDLYFQPHRFLYSRGSGIVRKDKSTDATDGSEQVEEDKQTEEKED